MTLLVLVGCGGSDGPSEELCASFAMSQCAWMDRACGAQPPGCIDDVQQACIDGFPSANNNVDVQACGEYFDAESDCTDSADWPEECPTFAFSPDAGVVDCTVEACEGRFSVAWVITSSGSEVACADVGLTGASYTYLLMLPVGTTQRISEYFVCGDFVGTTDLLPAGSYTLVLQLVDGNNNVIHTGSVLDGTIEGTETVDLGTVTFDF